MQGSTASVAWSCGLNKFAGSLQFLDSTKLLLTVLMVCLDDTCHADHVGIERHHVPMRLQTSTDSRSECVVFLKNPQIKNFGSTLPQYPVKSCFRLMTSGRSMPLN